MGGATRILQGGTIVVITIIAVVGTQVGAVVGTGNIRAVLVICHHAGVGVVCLLRLLCDCIGLLCGCIGLYSAPRLCFCLLHVHRLGGKHKYFNELYCGKALGLGF